MKFEVLSVTDYRYLLISFYIIIATANNGILVRLNGRTVQILNLQASTDWTDYCHYYQQSSTYLTTTLSVICRSLGYEGMIRYSSKETNFKIDFIFKVIFNQFTLLLYLDSIIGFSVNSKQDHVRV